MVENKDLIKGLNQLRKKFEMAGKKKYKEEIHVLKHSSKVISKQQKRIKFLVKEKQQSFL